MRDVPDDIKLATIRHSRARAALLDAAALESARVYSRLCPEFEYHRSKPRASPAIRRVVELAKRMAG